MNRRVFLVVTVVAIVLTLSLDAFAQRGGAGRGMMRGDGFRAGQQWNTADNSVEPTRGFGMGFGAQMRGTGYRAQMRGTGLGMGMGMGYRANCPNTVCPIWGTPTE